MVDLETPARGRRIFLGYEQVKRAIDHGPSRLRAGFLLEGKVPARQSSEIVTVEGHTIGRITRGASRRVSGGRSRWAMSMPRTPRPVRKFAYRTRQAACGKNRSHAFCAAPLL